MIPGYYPRGGIPRVSGGAVGRTFAALSPLWQSRIGRAGKLPEDEQRRLALAYQGGSKDAGERLLGSALRIILAGVAHRGQPVLMHDPDAAEDLFQVACLWFLRGLGRWSPDGRAGPVGYAQWWVDAGLRQAVSRMISQVWVPESDRAGFWRFLRADPKVRPEARAALAPMVRLDECVDPDGDGESRGDRMASNDAGPEDEAGDRLRREKLAARYNACLQPRQRRVLSMRAMGARLEDVGQTEGFSRERARQVEAEAMVKVGRIRRAMGA